MIFSISSASPHTILFTSPRKTTVLDLKRDHAILKILYYGQLRRSEVINLNVDDVDFQRQKLRINQGKGNQYDEVNIHPDALQSIANYLQVRDLPQLGHEKALFLSREGRRIGRTDIPFTIKRYAQKAGINKRVYPICLEHQV